jgi:hypothetical protein
MLSNLIGQFAPRFRRKISGHDRRTEGGEMVAKHIALNAAESIDDRGDLVRDVEAVARVFDHLLYAAHLSLYPTKSG